MKKLERLAFHFCIATLTAASAAAGEDKPTLAIINPETGIAIREEWRKNNEPNGVYHRMGGPSFISRRCGTDKAPLDVINLEYWERDGKLHRENGPAIIARDCNGNITHQEWWADGVKIYPSKTSQPERSP